MTDDSNQAPTGSGWGGRRPGAGRKPKNRGALPDIDLAYTQAERPPDEIEPVAQVHANDALNSLVKQLRCGSSESASVAAANAVLDRGYGKPATDIGGTGLLPFLGRAPSRNVATALREEAQKYARLALAVLLKIATSGCVESARVAAAKSLLERGLGAVGTARVATDMAQRPLSKREQAELAARSVAAGNDPEWGEDLRPKFH